MVLDWRGFKVRNDRYTVVDTCFAAYAKTEMLQLEKGITHAAKAAENGKWQVLSDDGSGPSVCRSSSARKNSRLTSLALLANHFIDPRLPIGW